MPHLLLYHFGFNIIYIFSKNDAFGLFTNYIYYAALVVKLSFHHMGRWVCWVQIIVVGCM